MEDEVVAIRTTGLQAIVAVTTNRVSDALMQESQFEPRKTLNTLKNRKSQKRRGTDFARQIRFFIAIRASFRTTNDLNLRTAQKFACSV